MSRIMTIALFGLTLIGCITDAEIEEWASQAEIEDTGDTGYLDGIADEMCIPILPQTSTECAEGEEQQGIITIRCYPDRDGDGHGDFNSFEDTIDVEADPVGCDFDSECPTGYVEQNNDMCDDYNCAYMSDDCRARYE